MMPHDNSIHECPQLNPTQRSNVRNKFLDFSIIRAPYHTETDVYYKPTKQTTQFTFYPTIVNEKTWLYTNTVILRLTSDPANDFFC